MPIRSLAVIAVIIAMLPLSLPAPLAAKKAGPTCESFLSQGDAQAAYDADTSDPYGLDPDGNGAACDQASGQGGDPETLDAPQSATPQDATNPTDTASQPDSGKAKKAKNSNASDTTPSTSSGNDVTVTTSSGGGESLEARLEARFAELEAQFAAFSGNDDTTSNGGQSSPVVVSTAPPETTSGASSSVPSTTSSAGTGTTTALHRGHHGKGHGKGHGKHHKGHKNGKHQKKGHHKHH